MSETEHDSADTGQNHVDKVPTLAGVFEERGVLPEPELLRTFVQVLVDLELAHGNGMLHRDISPARIILNSGGTWKLTEYGHAKVGTVRYMSPERCQGKPMDLRSDIYSLGVVLFQAATGRLPFEAEMKFQIMEAHASTPPPLPSTLNPSVSSGLEQAILRSLAKDPAERFQTAGEFRQALEALATEPDQSSAQLVEPAAEPKPQPEPELEVDVRSETESTPSAPEAESRREPRRFKPAAVLVPFGAAVAVVAGLLLAEVVGTRRVPLVTGMSLAEAEQMLRGKGLHTETDSVDDTLAAGTVATQVPAAGQRTSRSRVVRLEVSTGKVAVPVLAGLTLDDARARLVKLTLTAAKVDSQYSDDYSTGVVVSSKVKPGARLVLHSGVGLAVSAGRATCPQCGAKREARAKFCTKCGYKY